MNKTKTILSKLINQTISQLLAESVIIKKLEAEVGEKFIKKHLKNLKQKVINEIELSSDKKDRTTYVSLLDIFPKNEVSQQNISRIETYIYTKLMRKRTPKKYLINLVFPCRNSSKIVKNSIELLISEIKKSHDIDFNVIFQVNNTSDDTLSHIVKALELYSDLTNKADYYILETEPGLQFSLPGSLNLGYSFIDAKTKLTTKKYKGVFFSFWDDELVNLIPTSDSLFNSNMNALLSSSTNKAISGYMIDNRVGISYWHEICKGFSSDIRFIHSKPYLHGGSGTVMRMGDYPKDGIKLGGIADTDLSEDLLKKVDYKLLQSLSWDEWPVRSNHLAPVFHPIETDILKWTTKYLMYQIAWKNSLKLLNDSEHKIGNLWEKRLAENRIDFHKRINNYLINLSPEKIIEREFMHFYYLTIQRLENKVELYDKLKAFRTRSLEVRSK